MSNILEFPQDRMRNNSRKETDDDEFRRNRLKFVDRVTSHHSSQLLNKLAYHGFEIENDKFMYDYIFMVEALRACLYRNIGEYHPLQQISSTTKDIVDGEGDDEDE